MNKKVILVIAAILILAAAGWILFLALLKGFHKTNASAQTEGATSTEATSPIEATSQTAEKETEYPLLQGEWREVNCTEPITFSFLENSFQYLNDNDDVLACSFDVCEGENYNLGLENALTVCADPEKGPWYAQELVYHTQDVDGHTVRILDSFMYEDDGRGLIVFCEYVHTDDLPYVGEDFCSELYYRLNDAEAVPTYIENGNQ